MVNGIKIWDEIERNKELYSQKIMEQQYFNAAMNIPIKYKEKYMQDSKYNLTFLASALRFNNPNSYREYMSWLAQLMNTLNVPLGEMMKHFEQMEKVLDQELKEFDREPLKTFIIQGMESFEKEYENNFLKTREEIIHPDVSYFLELILNFQRDKASNFIMNKLEKGEDIRDIYVSIFQPTLYQVGLLWHKQSITVAKEHYATSVIQSIIGMMYPYLFKEVRKNGKNFIGTCSGSELHEIGLRMVADFLEMEGWDTYYLGANLPIEYVLEEVKSKNPEVLGISTTTLPNLSYAKELIDQVRNDPAITHTKIMVGGKIYKENQDLWKEMGADGFAEDAKEALKIAEKLSEGK